jgi:MFS family permease
MEEQQRQISPTTPTNMLLPPIKLYKRRWLLLIIFALSQFLCTVYQMTFASISTVVLDYYHIPFDTWKVNSLAMIYSIVYVPTSLLSSFVMKRFGLKFSVFIAVMLNFIGGCVRFAGFKKGHEVFFWIVFLGQCITAVAQPFVGNATTMLASNWFGEKERATATTLATFFSILGSAAIFGIGPWLAGNESETGMMILLGGEAALACVLLVLFVAIFRDKPPTPPSYRHHHNHHITSSDETVPVSPSVNDEESDTEINTEHHVKLVTPMQVAKPLESNSFFKDFWLIIKNFHFIMLLISYSVGYGVVQSFVTLLDQIIVPMGYTVKDGSIFGVAVVLAGMIGAVVMGIIADYTKRYKLLLVFCASIGTGAFAWFSIIMMSHKTTGKFITSAIAIALLGMFACPTVPLTLELSVETTFPVTESTSASILNAVATLVSATCILILDLVERDAGKGKKTGSMQMSLWIMLGLLVASIFCALLFNSKYKRLEHESSLHKQQREQSELPTETSPILLVKE